MATQASTPFAVDDSATYWATYSIEGLAGSQVVRTPMP
jgi:hypothetical protein